MSTRASVAIWDDVSELLFGEKRARLRRGVSRKLLQVFWKDESLEFVLLPDMTEFGPSRVTGGPASIGEFLRGCDSFLNAMSSQKYHDAATQSSSLLNLEALGAGIFQRLLPGDLQQRIREWPDGTILGVSSNEQWIPWELMHDGRGFMGQRMLLVRMPRLTDGAADAAGRCGRAVTNAASVGYKIVNVVGGDLDGEVERCKSLFAAIEPPIEVCPLYGVALSELMAEIRDADVVHLTCHGHRNPLRLQIYRSDNQVVNLLIDSVRLKAFCLKPRCLVYANACSSAAAQALLGDFVSFGVEFYKKGAAAFIGTLGTVPTEAALAFSQQFYRHLAGDRHGDVYSAYQDTRGEAIANGPTCLLFCIYGNYLDDPSLELFYRKGNEHGAEGSGR